MFSFRLSDDFLDSYRGRSVPWGYTDAAGNSVGEITFLRTYSRLKEDGSKEQWYEVCARVINGMYSIQKDHCKDNRLPWNDRKAQASGQEAFERMFTLKWTPPGRGLWVMGTPLVMEQRNSAPLQNCAFISTADMTKANPAKPFAFLMEASMLGVGVGFDTKGTEKGFTIYKPSEQTSTFVIPDTREGWVESVSMVINSYLRETSTTPIFDYTQIRPEGTPIKTFGGTAAGHAPLEKLHNAIRAIFDGRHEESLTVKDIADIGNLIGVCVVAGNVRRSAELLMGDINDTDFIDLKNYDINSERAAWGWMSNNSVEAKVGSNYEHLVENIATNGEPGVIWMDVTRKYGRLIDAPNNKDWRAAGYNPCAEQSLESGECCTLVETYINRHDSLDDFKRTLKFAFLYAKTVTLLPTHWPETNAIMQRNRRIGTGISGIANFADRKGLPALRSWFDEGYRTVQDYDRSYSEWLGIRESIKLTTVKPSGTVSILAGESPGAHWSVGGEYFNRGIVFQKNDPMVTLLQAAGYNIEPSAYTPETSVFIQFPIHSLAKRSEKDVSIFEKVNLAVESQRWWSDNSVSVTVSFDGKTEKEHVGTVLHMHEGHLKSVSFLPMGNEIYAQMPYQNTSKEEIDNAALTYFKVDWSPLYAGDLKAIDAIGEKYCTTDKCEVPIN